ncbi:MAG: RNA methyltransferase [Clostridium sp.]|jgi:TrmH family RNA methyltransferase|nr:RNA methyltransferase [Clostridium sp.]
MIASVSNPKVKQVARLQSQAKERRSQGVFVAEGLKMYQEAPWEAIREVYVSEQFLKKEVYGGAGIGSGAGDRACPAASSMEYTASMERTFSIRRKLEQTGYETVSQEVFAKMSDEVAPMGILTVLHQPKHSLEDLLRRENPLLLLLEDLQDPGNLGTMIRTAEAAGAAGIIMSGQTADVFGPKVVRSAMGAVCRVPFVYVEDLAAAMRQLRGRGIRIYAAHPRGDADYTELSYGTAAVLIGNEGNGLRESTAAAADLCFRIPMEGRAESLNAAVAAAVVLYEAYRQKRGRCGKAKPRNQIRSKDSGREDF